MAQFELLINGTRHQVEADPGASLLWILREDLGLTGTKYGCGIAQCGTCTIHVDGNPMRACALRVENVSGGQQITTIEGLSEGGNHPLQEAWIAAQVPQCGYCQPGQIMQAAALLSQNPTADRETIRNYMSGVLCRCGTYMRILEAIERAGKAMTESKTA